jgi:hypothetical protein
MCIFYEAFKKAKSKVMENNPLFLEGLIANIIHAILAFYAKTLTTI